MPTTRSGAHYGPGALSKSTSAAAKQALSSKRKTTVGVKLYAKTKPQPSKTKNTKIRQTKDAGKKKAVQYKKLPVITKAQKTYKIQATKRKEAVDKRRFGGPRIQPDGADFPDTGTSKLIAETKPGYIFIQQQVDPENDNHPVDIYKIEVNDKDEMPPEMIGCGAFKLILMPSTCCKVAGINEAKSAVCNALGEYTSRFLREGWFKVPEEELDTFIDLYNNAVNDYKA